MTDAPLSTSATDTGPTSERLQELRATFAVSGPPGSRQKLKAMLRGGVLLYWLACLAVIALGVDRMHPEWRQGLAAQVAASAGKGS